MMGEASLETSPKNNMIQGMINSDNMNSTESIIPNILLTHVGFFQQNGLILSEDFLYMERSKNLGKNMS